MLASGVARGHAICSAADMSDNEMREFEIGNGKTVLVIRQNGEFTAVAAKCTHYGAPLVKGALGNGRVRCPWHGACFSTKSGDIEDYPGLDSLAKFNVEVRGGVVTVVASEAALTNAVRHKNLHCKNTANNKTVLIIGAGAAAQTCVETLRQEGFTGRIVMATKELHSPYDRTKISKAMEYHVSHLLLRNADFYSEADIEILTNREATAVDILKKQVTFKEGEPIRFDMLLIATGGSPVNAHVKNNTLRNVCLLRTPEDANYIAGACTGKNVVINGSSFIGMEVASFLREKAQSLTVISRSGTPFGKLLGEVIGQRLKRLYEENGVTFCSGTVSEFRGKDGSLTEVVLDSGRVLPADVCVNGIGVRPSTDFVLGSGIPISTTGYIPVDKRMRTEVNGVYAAGDVVTFPLFIRDDQPVNIGHWQMAHAHGKVAAMNMLDKSMEIRSVPFFWSVMFKRSVRYAGYGEGFDDVLIQGNLAKLKFLAYYTKGDKVVAVASMNSDPDVAKFAELLASGKTLNKSEIGECSECWAK